MFAYESFVSAATTAVKFGGIAAEAVNHASNRVLPENALPIIGDEEEWEDNELDDLFNSLRNAQNEAASLDAVKTASTPMVELTPIVKLAPVDDADSDSEHNPLNMSGWSTKAGFTSRKTGKFYPHPKDSLP